MKKIFMLLFLSIILMTGCRKNENEKMMIVTTTKNEISVNTVMPFNQKLMDSLKDSTDIQIKIIK